MLKLPVPSPTEGQARMLAMSLGSLIATAKTCRDQVKEISIDRFDNYPFHVLKVRTRTGRKRRLIDTQLTASIVMALVHIEAKMRARHKRKLKEKRKNK